MNKQNKYLDPTGPLGLIIIFLVLALAPLFVGPFYVRLLAVGILYGVAAVGFNILFGYTGLLSFGHAMFWGMGAYGVAIGLEKFGLGFIGSFTLAICILLGLSVVTGFLSLRHTKIYFAMLTLAFGQLVYAIILKWRDLTGGDEGIYGIPRPLETVTNYYYLIIAISIVILLLIWRLLNSPLGVAFQTIRDNPYRAEVLGYPVKRVRMLSYVVSGLVTGVAGMLYSPLQGAITPESLYWTFSAAIVFMAVLGGPRIFIGPFIGGIVYVLLMNYAMDITEYWMMAMGIMLALLIYLLPQGIVGGIFDYIKKARGETK